jgi:hypothetical protein
MQIKRPPARGGSYTRVLRVEDMGFQTAQRSETAAAWLVSSALVVAISLFIAEALFHSRVLY